MENQQQSHHDSPPEGEKNPFLLGYRKFIGFLLWFVLTSVCVALYFTGVIKNDQWNAKVIIRLIEAGSLFSGLFIVGNVLEWKNRGTQLLNGVLPDGVKNAITQTVTSVTQATTTQTKENTSNAEPKNEPSKDGTK